MHGAQSVLPFPFEALDASQPMGDGISAPYVDFTEAVPYKSGLCFPEWPCGIIHCKTATESEMQIFENDDAGYLRWVEANRQGYVANFDEPQYVKDYPKVHRATHQAVTTSQRGNYTTKQYQKACSQDLVELESWSRTTFNKKLTRCKVCM